MSNELDQLDNVAAIADAGAAESDNPGGEVPAMETGPDFGKEAAGAVDMFAAMIVGYAPAAASIWTEPAKARTAAALVPVMEKYGFSFGSLPPELTFAIVAGPLLWQSSRLVAAQMEADKAKAVQQARPVQGIEKATHEAVHTAPAPERHPQEALYKQ